jgi:hypothetical protein
MLKIHENNFEIDKQRTYDTTSWSVRVTTVAMETQHVTFVLYTYMKLVTIYEL